MRFCVNHPNTVSPYFECLEAYSRNCKNMSNILILVLRNKNHWFWELNRVKNMCFICFGFHLLGMETDKTQLLGWLSLSPVFFSPFCCNGLDRFLRKFSSWLSLPKSKMLGSSCCLESWGSKIRQSIHRSCAFFTDVHTRQSWSCFFWL